MSMQKQHLRSTHFWFQKWVCSTMEIELVVVGRSGFFSGQRQQKIPHPSGWSSDGQKHVETEKSADAAISGDKKRL